MIMEKLTSVSNPVIKSLRALKTVSGRQEQGLISVEGEVMINEALKCGLVPKTALVSEPSAVASTLQRAGAKVYIADMRLIESVCDTKTPQGCVCSFNTPAARPIVDARFIVALDGVQDPGNVGTIIRTADAAGFDGVLLGRGCADVYSQKVQRAAMGSAFRMALEAGELARILPEYRLKGFSIVVSRLDGEPLYQSPRPAKAVLVIGNEARGVSDEIKSLADIGVKIPMRGGAESLNAAVAAGVLMYELTR